MIEYRELSAEEKQKIKAVFPAFKGDVSTFTVMGTVEDGDVTSFAVLAWAAHCEPVYIKPKSRVDFRRLERLVEAEAKRMGAGYLWVLAHNEHIERMAEICGGKVLDTKVMRKEI